LRSRIEDNELHSGTGVYSEVSVIDDYVSHVVNDIKLKRKMKIVIDCGNGVGGATAPQLFKQLGCDVTELFS
jgi:phosphomannomutase/phosphoglucomutase